MTSPGITRREFLLWTGALGASVALPLRWMDAEPVRLGFVGLGRRGRQALSTCLGLPGTVVSALCDRRQEALSSALASLGLTAALTTREPHELFTDPRLDAVVLAASEDAQAPLAAAACAAGKDVLLLRPLSFDPAVWDDVLANATRFRRQVQVARTTAFALQPTSAGRLTAAGDGAFMAAEVGVGFQSVERPKASTLLGDLLDEIDFAQAVLGGGRVRSFKVGGAGLLPGRWIDQQWHHELIDESADRRWMKIHLTASRGAATPKASRLRLRGDLGAVELLALPLLPGDPTDLGLFLGAVRDRQRVVGLSLSRALELSADFLTSRQA